MAPSSDLRLQIGMPACAALPLLAAPLLDEAVDCAERAAENGDPELIHRLRVSLRQLRSLLWAYVPLLPDGAAALWRTRLGALANVTGTAREWSVLATELAPAMVPHDPVRARVVLDRLEWQTERATDACRQALVAAEPASVLSQLRATLAVWSATPVPSPPLGAFATARLRDAYRILRKRAAAPQTTAGALHRTRIAVKRVHYLTMLFAPVLARPTVRRVQSFKRLQLHLGRANDTATAIALLRQTMPPLAGHRLQRRMERQLSRLHARNETKARHTLARIRKYLKL